MKNKHYQMIKQNLSKSTSPSYYAAINIMKYELQFSPFSYHYSLKDSVKFAVACRISSSSFPNF